MECPNCGATVTSQAGFCEHCGHAFAPPPGPAPIVQVQPSGFAPAQQPQQQWQAPPPPQQYQQGMQQQPGQFPGQGYAQPVQPYPPQGYQQAPQGYYQQPPAKAPKDVGLCVLLELLGGGLFQVFGIGNIVAGNIGIGIALMLSYWVLQFINALLTMLIIGFITLPLTWLLYMIMAPLLAASAAKKTRAG